MLALLANPGSGSGEAEDVERLLAESGRSVRRFALDDRSAVVEARPERIVVAGGDGSIGCAAEAAALAGVPLGVVPVGTANDFARALGLPSEPEPAAKLAATGPRTARLDLGFAGKRPFVNAASAGLSPVAARKARGLKRALGPLAYALGALRAGLTARPVSCRARVDGALAFAGDAWQVIVGLTGAFGAGAEVAADPADGRLDLVVLEAGSRARLLLHAHGLRAGEIEGRAGVVSRRGDRIELETDGGSGFNIDGELLEGAAVELTVRPGAFEVVVPA